MSASEQKAETETQPGNALHFIGEKWLIDHIIVSGATDTVYLRTWRDISFFTQPLWDGGTAFFQLRSIRCLASRVETDIDRV